MFSIYHIQTGNNVFVGTYKELVEYCNSMDYKIFLKMINKKDYALGKF